MSTTKHAPQRGQILVIFAGGLVTLLVIAALVIDVGFTFMIRRAEQNAADPGAIAAARFIPSGNYAGMVSAACFYAQQNGFFSNAPGYPTSTGCVPANDAFGSTLTVNWPPSAAAGPWVGDAGKVEVIIGRQHRSFLAGIIGITRIGVATNAVAAFGAGTSNSSSLIALDPGGCGSNAAGFITGGGTVEINPVTPGIEGGYVHVNSSCGSGAASSDDWCDNSGGSSALKIDGGGTLISPGVYTVGSCKNSGIITTSTLDEGSVLIGDPLSELPPPSFGPPGAFCGNPALDPPTVIQTTEAGAEGCDFKDKDTTYHLSPGVYYGGWKVTGKNVTLHLDPGIYVIAGGGISIGATGTISSVSGATGPAPVLIFSTDDPLYAATCKSGGGTPTQCQDKLSFNADTDLLLHGMDTGPYKGLLIWQDGKGSGATGGSDLDVNLGGQTSLSLTGTIYNPRGVVTLDGGSIASGYASVQIISWNWKIAGSGTLHMPYDPNELYHFDQKGLVR
jgi:hypothetical protein